MKVNDWIKINEGLDVYETVYASVAALSDAANVATDAQASRGIGRVIEVDGKYLKIKWLKNKYVWGHYDIKKSIHVIKDTIINTLYGSNK